MNDSGFWAIKLFFTGLCAAFSAAFGWMGWMIAAWVICMAMDWVTGSIAACRRGEWSSAAAREGIFHKAGMIFVVLIAAIADGVLCLVMAFIPALAGIRYPTVILPVVLVWYIFTELGSVAENSAAMGAPVPKFLVRILAATRQAAEDAVPDGGKEE
jgi:toxin secretion/phage lysis holin